MSAKILDLFQLTRSILIDATANGEESIVLIEKTNFEGGFPICITHHFQA